MDFKSDGFGATKKNSDSSLYDSWDPMTDVCNSLANLLSTHSKDPLAVSHGTDRFRPEELPCRFHKPDSRCGRQGCRYRHCSTKYPTPLVLKEVTLMNELRLKTRAPAGIINIGIVVTTLSPGDFCIVPYSDWACGCKLESRSEEHGTTFANSVYDPFQNHGDGVKNSGVANLQRLFEDFRQFDRFQRLKKLLSVCANQVVAVKITSSTDRVRKDWYRAVALEDVVISSSNTTVPLFLLDYGMYTNSLIQNLVLLPSKLLRYPPLGYRCQLNGASPISHCWSKNACSLFSEMVSGKECIFELIRSSASEDVVFETSPNLVELSVFDGKNYVNLSNKLISEGLGIEWNIFPKHNNILKGMDDARACGLLLAKKPFHCGVDERNLEKVPDHNFSAVEREHRVRLSITQPQITTKLCSGTANAPFFRSSHCALTQAPMALTRWNLEETPNSLKPLDPLIHQIHGSEVEATNEALKNSIQKAKGSNVNTQGQKKRKIKWKPFN